MTKTIGDSLLMDVWATTGNVQEPDESKKAQGWALGEQPPHEYMNWLHKTFGEKINHIMQYGIPVWNSDTTYPVGSITTANDAIWKCLVENTNSEPTSGNSNWDEIPGLGGIVTPDPVPTGAVFYFAAVSPPTGYLVADGSAISRATYLDLFNTVGTVFGVGNGTTTFNLPDLRGEFIRGYDGGRGVDSGRAFGSAQADALKSHTHTIDIIRNNTNSGNYTEDASSGGDAYSNVTGATGGTETRPRNIALLPCIKY